MGPNVTRVAIVLALAGVVSMCAAGGAEPRTPRPVAAAQAYAVRVVVAGGETAGTPVAGAPPDTVSLEGAFSYPADGSVVTTESATASAASSVVAAARGRASSEGATLSLFRGEITAARVTVRARAFAGARRASGDTSGTAVTGLAVFGQPATAGRVQLGDWGTLEVGTGEALRTGRSGINGFSASATALAVRLTQPHGR